MQKFVYVEIVDRPEFFVLDRVGRRHCVLARGPRPAPARQIDSQLPKRPPEFRIECHRQAVREPDTSVWLRNRCNSRPDLKKRKQED